MGIVRKTINIFSRLRIQGPPPRNLRPSQGEKRPYTYRRRIDSEYERLPLIRPKTKSNRTSQFQLRHRAYRGLSYSPGGNAQPRAKNIILDNWQTLLRHHRRVDVRRRHLGSAGRKYKDNFGIHTEMQSSSTHPSILCVITVRSSHTGVWSFFQRSFSLDKTNGI